MKTVEKKILVIDDEAVIRSACRLALEKDGFQVDLAQNGEQGLSLFQAGHHDLILLDLMMPGLSGFQVLERLNDIDPDVVKIIITGYATVPVAVEAMKLGAHDFFPKPFAPDDIRIVVRLGFEKRRLLLENRSLKQEQERIKNNLVSLVSHELKSPLGAAVQYLEIILNGMAGNVSPESEVLIQRSVSRLREMIDLINRWMSLATVDSQTIRDRFEPVDISLIIEKSLDDHKVKAEAATISLGTDFTASALFVRGNPVLIAEIVNNLVSNAIKYNRPGGSVRISLSSDGEHVRIIVEDTGIGITQENLKHVFDEFFRVDGRRTSSVRGAGLGLSIVKKLVEIHEGSICIHSTYGKGTRVECSLPCLETNLNCIAR
ncbi:MAG: hybrid sensor histidine kinase/response regulator [Pseudomonadota bacterium]